MINYIEKGFGLHQRLTAAGLQIQQIDSGEWTCAGDHATAQAIINAYSLADTKAEICARINEHARSLRDAAVAGTSAAEMASWPIKRAEALAYAASANSADAPVLSAEAVARGVPLAEIVARVQANAAALSMLEAAIAGASGKHRDAVNALGTFAEVLAYDFSTGWPALP